MDKLAYFLRFTFVGILLVSAPGCWLFTPGPFEEGVPTEGNIVDGVPVNPEDVPLGTQGSSVNLCYSGLHNPGRSTLGDIADRQSVDGTVTVAATDLTPTMEISVIMYEPCVMNENEELECTGKIGGVARLMACVDDSTTGARECYTDDLDGDLSDIGYNGWFFFQAEAVYDSSGVIWFDAMFENQFDPAIAEVYRNDNGVTVVDWDFVMAGYTTGTDAPFPSSSLLGELVFAQEQTLGPRGSGVSNFMTGMADVLIENTFSPITGSLSNFQSCQ